MTDLINHLRTGTHEQAVGLLRECWDLTHRATIPSPVMSGYAAWRMADDAFGDLLSIGTPEACVGAAMMLMPEGWGVNLSIPEKYDAVIRPAGIISKPVTLGPPFIGPVVALANVPALALAAAIMETRNG